MVTLDGNPYYVYQTNYSQPPRKFVDEEVGMTGATLWAVAETGVGEALIEDLYQLTLLCLPADLDSLRLSFAKPGALDFVDERSVHRDPLTGSGVLFRSLGAARPMTSRGFTNGNRFLVEVELLVERAGE